MNSVFTSAAGRNAEAFANIAQADGDLTHEVGIDYMLADIAVIEGVR